MLRLLFDTASAILAIGAGAAVVFTSTPDAYLWTPYAAAGATLVGGFLLGAVFVIIMLRVAFFVVGAAAIGVVIALASAQWLRLPGVLLTGLAAFVIHRGQVWRRDEIKRKMDAAQFAAEARAWQEAITPVPAYTCPQCGHTTAATTLGRCAYCDAPLPPADRQH